MHFQKAITTCVLALAAAAYASPLPTFNDIERRWSEGESEASIHGNIDIREATPAWPVARAAEFNSFAESLDKRTQDRARVLFPREEETTLTRIRAYVTKLFQERGMTGMIEARSDRETEEAPVLRPRKEMRYSWAA